MGLADLLAPAATLEQFVETVLDKHPLHVRSADAASPLIDWRDFNALLGIHSHWTAANLNLVMNSRPVQPEFYLDEVDTSQGVVKRATLEKVDVFLSMGASLVANAVDEISPRIRQLTAGIGELLSARVAANAYCSFKDVQAFPSHCDLHDVLAIQCEGEKTWRIYANRAPSPVTTIEGDNAQDIIDAAKGPVLMTVTMKPGDVLYIPRGFYHDALASSGASLHVTISIARLTGMSIFQMLESIASEDQAFRNYLADANASDGALGAQLEALAGRIGTILTSRRFSRSLADRQRRLWKPDRPIDLPRQRHLDFYARTGTPAELHQQDGDLLLRTSTATVPLNAPSELAEYILGRNAFVLQEVLARFPYVAEKQAADFVAQLARLNLIRAYTPQR